jgi:hypothetical protein
MTVTTEKTVRELALENPAATRVLKRAENSPAIQLERSKVNSGLVRRRNVKT